jgi:hypothetical protein
VSTRQLGKDCRTAHALLKETRLVLDDAVADLELGGHGGRCASKRSDVAELADGHRMSDPVKELLVGDQPDVCTVCQRCPCRLRTRGGTVVLLSPVKEL